METIGDEVLKAAGVELVHALHPKVVDAVSAIVTEAKARGMVVGLQSGLRTGAQQDKLYALGRTVVNPDGKTDTRPMGLIATNARAYESYHCLGLAADIVFKDAKGNWTWNKKPEEWDALGAVGKMFGMAWGGDWSRFPDYPHFQMIGKIPDVRTAKKILFEQGLDALWAMV